MFGSKDIGPVSFDETEKESMDRADAFWIAALAIFPFTDAGLGLKDLGWLALSSSVNVHKDSSSTFS